MANVRIWLVMAVLACMLLTKAAMAEEKPNNVKANGTVVDGNGPQPPVAGSDDEDDTYYPKDPSTDQDNHGGDLQGAGVPDGITPYDDDDDKDDDVEEFLDINQELVILGH